VLLDVLLQNGRCGSNRTLQIFKTAVCVENK
jgi:hypothetical protein